MESFSLQIELITALMGYERFRNETVSDNILFELVWVCLAPLWVWVQ